MTVCPTEPLIEVRHCLISMAELTLFIALSAVVVTLGLLLCVVLPWAVFGKSP
jgi:hypothetical protein